MERSSAKKWHVSRAVRERSEVISREGLRIYIFAICSGTKSRIKGNKMSIAGGRGIHTPRIHTNLSELAHSPGRKNNIATFQLLSVQKEM